MEKARVKRKRKRETETRKPSPVQPTDEESTCEQLSKLPATEGPTGTVTQFVYINEDGILKEEEYVEEEKLIELLENDHADEEISKSCIVTNPSPSESINTAEASNTKNHSSSLDLGSGLPALKIPGRAGSISIYTDGVDYFYRKNRHVLLKSGLDTWYMSCTYDDCQGKGIMQLKDDKLTLYHRYPHSCEPIPCLADLMDMKKRIMERCKSDRITPLRQIFDEETMSPDYAPEIGALLSYSSMESAMQKARGKLFHPKW